MTRCLICSNGERAKGKKFTAEKERRFFFLRRLITEFAQHNMVAPVLVEITSFSSRRKNKFNGANHKSILYLPLYAWMARFSNHHCWCGRRFLLLRVEEEFFQALLQCISAAMRCWGLNHDGWKLMSRS